VWRAFPLPPGEGQGEGMTTRGEELFPLNRSPSLAPSPEGLPRERVAPVVPAVWQPRLGRSAFTAVAPGQSDPAAILDPPAAGVYL
jgi:hypothetical protein